MASYFFVRSVPPSRGHGEPPSLLGWAALPSMARGQHGQVDRFILARLRTAVCFTLWRRKMALKRFRAVLERLTTALGPPLRALVTSRRMLRRTRAILGRPKAKTSLGSLGTSQRQSWDVLGSTGAPQHFAGALQDNAGAPKCREFPRQSRIILGCSIAFLFQNNAGASQGVAGQPWGAPGHDVWPFWAGENGVVCPCLPW